MARLTLLLLALLSWPTLAITLADVQQQLTAADARSARFEQERQISGLTQALRSSGELLLVKGQGLWWQQQKPFPLTLTLTPTRMVQQLPGQPAQTLDSPQLLEFSNLMLALFDPSEAALDNYFRHKLASEGEEWTLTLEPIRSPLDKVFASLVLKGRHELASLAIHDKQGDVTLIRFVDWQLKTLPLSTEEQSRFDAH
ncbi:MULTISPECIES: outer membrane lipoprotein carrier protein LolA [Aeromonas]|uniref:outer membrane lipoprotein carrier protein LolA n=1 Tax=Aeromonas TaxID=642 RepID=UPI00191EBB71|nr:MULTISPECIES: outer membrane lipoprotein carrier protein LolA [Aeromonas]MBL0612680.1 outer membrane lipoprotein carrier protein LolA [Aeromonas jandaei]MCQ4055960.1 outer membrane lipoprotein carrier protein LolA [Aeromonas sp. SG16]